MLMVPCSCGRVRLLAGTGVLLSRSSNTVGYGYMGIRKAPFPGMPGTLCNPRILSRRSHHSLPHAESSGLSNEGSRGLDQLLEQYRNLVLLLKLYLLQEVSEQSLRLVQASSPWRWQSMLGFPPICRRSLQERRSGECRQQYKRVPEICRALTDFPLHAIDH